MLDIAVVGVVNDNGKILIGKKRAYKENDVLSEKWHIPGGKVEANEHPNSALEREILEETGIKVVPSRVLDVCVVKKPEQKYTIVIWYECKPLETNIASSEELSHVKWVDKSQIFTSVDKEAIGLFPPLVIDYFKN